MRDYFKRQSAGTPKSRVYDPHSSTARRCPENEIATMLKQRDARERTRQSTHPQRKVIKARKG